MSKYQSGKIYKVVDNTNNNIYIGSTVDTLSQRLSNHLSTFKRLKESNIGGNCTINKILENGDYSIELIELFPCETKIELEGREAHHIVNNQCINKKKKGSTIDRKDYYQIFRDNNKEKIKDWNKTYRDKNKEKLSAHLLQKVDCLCGAKICLGAKSTHLKSKKHLLYTLLNPQI